MAVAACWSELPKELLNHISERFDNEVDLIRFRSICSNWRTSSIPIPYNTLPFKLPLLKYIYPNDDIDNEEGVVSNPINNSNTSSFSYLSKRSHFLIKPSSQQQQQDQTLVRPPWLIQIVRNSIGKTILFHPLFSYVSPYYFRLTHLDFNKLSVLHLGTDFILEEQSLRYDDYMYPKKVVPVTYLILAILLDTDHLVLFRCSDHRWIDITDMSSSIGDICVFKGRIYAVNVHGSKTVKVGPEDLSVQLVANHVDEGSGDTKFLVESEGELLLVDITVSNSFESTELLLVDITESNSFESTVEDALTVNVFRLDDKEKEWVKLTSLGNRILFLGNGCPFSASASDLSVAKGNCVIFMDNFVYNNKICNNASGMCVFDLDQGRVLPLSDYPDYLNLFWPPPEWIVKSYMRKTKKRVKQRKRT